MTDREKNSETAIQDYLDDQLSPVDRQQVEDQLAGDPGAQKELEELQLIGSALRQLPSCQLGDNFADQVMGGLTEDHAGAGREDWVEPHAHVPETHVPETHVPSPASGRPRIAAWSAVVAAVLVLGLGIGIAMNLDNGDPPPHLPGGTVADENLRDDTTPDAAPEMTPLPEEEMIPGTVNVDALVADQFLFVMEIGLSEKGEQSKVIDRVLMKHGIVFDNSIQVDMDLEKELLENRFLEGIARKPSDPKSRDEQVDLIYVVCSGRQVDEMSRDLHNYHGEVAAYRFNLAIMPADMEAFGNLEKAIASQWKPDDSPAAEKSPLAGFRNRAGRLMMDLVVISGMGRSLTGSILSSGNDVPDPPAAPPKRETVKPRQPGVAQMGDDLVCEILLVVRTMSKEEIARGAK